MSRQLSREGADEASSRGPLSPLTIKGTGSGKKGTPTMEWGPQSRGAGGVTELGHRVRLPGQKLTPTRQASPFLINLLTPGFQKARIRSTSLRFENMIQSA